MTGPTRKKLNEEIKGMSECIISQIEDTYLRTCIKSSTVERAGVPDTAKLETRGMRDTISLQVDNFWD